MNSPPSITFGQVLRKTTALHSQKQTEKSQVFCILRFSRNQFLSKKREVFPIFLRNGSADRAENFFAGTSNILGCVFFLVSRNLVLKKFGSLYKLSTIAKNMTFRKPFSILLLIFDVDGSFKKTHTHTHTPIWVYLL